jgi:hypothetical protein
MTDRVYGYDHATVSSPSETPTDERYMWCEADGAIAPGCAVVIDVGTAYTTRGKPLLVIAGTAAAESGYMLGIYTGKGGTGTAATAVAAINTGGPTIPSTLKNAVDGDLIEVQIRGMAVASIDSDGALALGNPLVPQTSGAGKLTEASAGSAGLVAKIIAMEASSTTTGDGAMWVWIN